MRRAAAAILASLVLIGCATAPPEVLTRAPVANPTTETTDEIRSLPPAEQSLVVAVYQFRDQTGQHKPNEDFPEYSRAVTQGALPILVKALQDAGNGSWFTVTEREGLAHLLQERQLIRTNVEQFVPPGAAPPSMLPPLLNAGLILEGGIVSYDTNVLTGGFGARYLGIGASTEYRQDSVSVYLRAISTKTGQVLKSVTADKTVFSAGISAGVFRFVAVKRLLEIETGLTTNEPPNLAVRRAIEKAVHALIVEGAMAGFWAFADAEAGRRAIEDYLAGGETIIAGDLP